MPGAFFHVFLGKNNSEFFFFFLILDSVVDGCKLYVGLVDHL